MINETQEEINAYNQIRDLADKLCTKLKLDLVSWHCGSRAFGPGGYMDITITFCSSNAIKLNIEKQINNFITKIINDFPVSLISETHNNYGKNTKQFILALHI